jgi:hypothetical protein
MRLARCGIESVGQHRLQAVAALGEHLVGVPVGLHHDLCHGLDVSVRNVLVEQIAHRIDEDHPWSRPPKWIDKLLGHQA